MDCGSTHIEGLRKYVKENGMDAGFAYDGDADRCLAVDENGNLLVDGDGILTSLKVMELAKKERLSRLAEPMTVYPQVLINVRVKDKKTAQEDPAVQAAVKAVAGELGSTGRILVRESGTEPVVRVMVEAESEGRCRTLASG